MTAPPVATLGPEAREPAQQRGAARIRRGHFFGVNSLWCLDGKPWVVRSFS
jgi:hypothetical protein